MRRVVAVGSMRNLGDNLSLDSEALDDTQDQSISFHLSCQHEIRGRTFVYRNNLSPQRLPR